MADLRPQLRPLRRAFLLMTQLETVDFAIGSDGRNRFWTRPLLSKTGRNQPSTKENILAAPKWWRGVLVPTEGHALLDYSNQELWFAATMSGCPALLREVASGDVHLATAISIGLIPPGGDAETYKAERNRVKPLTHGTNYGISAAGIARKLGIPYRQAARLLREYDRAHPVYREWQTMRQRHAYATGRITSPMGWSMHVGPPPPRREQARYQDRPADEVNPRTLLNWLPQTMGGEVLRAAVVMLITHGFRVVGTAHDSLYLEVPLDRLEERVALARELMSSVTLPFTGGHPIPTKAHVVRPGERMLDRETQPMWDVVTALARAEKPGSSPRKKISDRITGETPPFQIHAPVTYYIGV
jgi:hypothetical protein